MKEPDSRPAPRLRFSKDERPEEATDTKHKRKVRWQLDSPADAAQNVVSQPSVSQMDENFTQRVNDAKAPDSDIMCEPDILAEYGHEPLPRGNATPHMSDDASTRPLFTRTKKRPTSKSDESQPRKATLSFEENAPKQPSKMKHQPQHRVSALVSDSLHRETQTSNEDGNVGVTAADQSITAVEGMAHALENVHHSHQLRKHRKSVQAASAPGDAHSSVSTYLQTGTGSKLMHSPPTSTTAGNTAASGVPLGTGHRVHGTPAAGSNPLSKANQKRSIRKGYIAARSGKTASGTDKTAKGTKAAAKKTTTAVEAMGKMLVRKKSSLVLVLLIAMLAIMMSLISSCAPIAQSAITSATLGTYPAEEDDIRAAEHAYSNMERELQRELDRYEHHHPGYDEYHVDQDEIWHDPYALIAIISARFGGEEWTIDTAYPVLELYFDLQYDLEEEIVRRTRYDEDGIPYTYTICNVTLTNKNLSHQPVYSMSREQLGMYALYMSTLGNMPDLFSGAHCSQLRDPVIHEVPQAYLDADPNFALLITEANKYVGYPYVWGGDSPETSFDCSGFLSYVFTTTGVRNTGRLGATGLYGVCAPIDPEDARPGDMVFFEGTMGNDVGGITHCGLYVGDGWFIHCGNPIGYAELDDWRSNFYGFGRAY